MNAEEFTSLVNEMEDSGLGEAFQHWLGYIADRMILDYSLDDARNDFSESYHGVLCRFEGIPPCNESFRRQLGLTRQEYSDGGYIACRLKRAVCGFKFKNTKP